MTETYAATVAAVAPVILLVAAVEINNRRQRVRELYEALAAPMGLIREMFRGSGDPSAQQVERVVQRVRETNVGARAGFALILYVLSAVAITTLLFLAELASLWPSPAQRGCRVTRRFRSAETSVSTMARSAAP